ncbi:patatin-like phospholipase family protein [Salinisphaera sp. Q1T1-3]|uniref:patatin-like phospholipase family protein n=1 Tax=Salinisphaera sp. Q1T1-3 TaxID=2321229 RepID=UPI000E767812|nr:patatin-like phospholipase family protein [Salinisphaera sp. Q1T1-3]RJS94063.1 patatin-like phospholipase family protein [Salinisphaera sp. Q1T1-3]
MADNAGWLTLKAGPAAAAALAEGPLTPARVGAVAAAAGGPRWLAITAFHQTLFGEWLAGRSGLPIVGSSIGAWAGAAACHPHDPASALAALAEAYIGQSYPEKPDAACITDTLADILSAALTPEVRCGVLETSPFDLHVLTVRSRGPTGAENRAALAAATAATIAGNTVSRRLLGAFYERVIFARDAGRIALADDGVPSRTVALSEANLFDALFASGNVPFIMRPVRDPQGAPRGAYRDGGLVDYHIDQPLVPRDAAAPIVLMPHFNTTLVPGWFDKQLPWRQRPRFADHTLMIGPGPAMRQAMVAGRVPERGDFYRYAGDDAARHRVWHQAMTAGARMRDAFFNLVARDALVDHLEPL